MRRLLELLRRSGPGLLLRARDFRLVWIAEVVSQIGDGLNRVALLWFVYQTNHSALQTSVVGVLQTVPPLVLGPVIGVYLDRLPKKPTLIVVSLAHGALVALLPLLYAFGLLDLLRLYALVLITSAVSTVAGPTLTLVVPLIVDDPDLRAANALLQSTGTIGVLLGPVVAGVAISALGTANALYLDAATFLFFVGCVAFVHVRESAAAAPLALGFGELLRDLREGLAFMIRKQAGIMLLTLVTCLENFGASAFIFLLPTLAKRNDSAHSLSIGGFWSAFGAGMLLATLLIATLRENPRRGLMVFVPAALGAGGVAIAALTYVHGWFAPAALMIVVGFATASLAPVVITLLQETTPEQLRGRVLTTFNTANLAMSMVGMLAFGWAADHIGENPTLVAVGVVLLAAAVLLAGLGLSSPGRRLVKNIAAPPGG